jgi:hypothetical protein
MKKLVLPVAVLALLGGRALLGAPPMQQEDAKAKAANWIEKADSTKALVDGVLAAAVEAGAEQHAVAKDYVTDASRWMTEGDKSLKAAKEAFAAEDYLKAGNLGNMAWQYYVKTGTAAVLANKLVSGGT